MKNRNNIIAGVIIAFFVIGLFLAITKNHSDESIEISGISEDLKRNQAIENAKKKKYAKKKKTSQKKSIPIPNVNLEQNITPKLNLDDLFYAPFTLDRNSGTIQLPESPANQELEEIRTRTQIQLCSNYQREYIVEHVNPDETYSITYDELMQRVVAEHPECENYVSPACRDGRVLGLRAPEIPTPPDTVIVGTFDEAYVCEDGAITLTYNTFFPIERSILNCSGDPERNLLPPLDGEEGEEDENNEPQHPGHCYEEYLLLYFNGQRGYIEMIGTREGCALPNSRGGLQYINTVDVEEPIREPQRVRGGYFRPYVTINERDENGRYIRDYLDIKLNYTYTIEMSMGRFWGNICYVQLTDWEPL